MPTLTKTCTRCKLDKDPTEFSRDRTRIDGRSKWCKLCVRDNSRKYYQTNHVDINERATARRLENPEHARELSRKSAAKPENRAKRNEYNRNRYYENREDILRKSSTHHRKRKYGLSEEGFDALLQSQNNQCAICYSVEGGGNGNAWHVDHNHSCCPGIITCGSCVRGILCSKCNQGIGYFQDSAEILRAAANYLEANAQGSTT